MPNLRTLGATVLAVGGAMYVLHPELLQFLAGESIGNGVRDIVTGGSILALVVGLRAIGWLEATGRIDRLVLFWAFSIWIGTIGVLNLVLFYSIPDSTGALGIVAVCVGGIGIMLYAAYEGRIEEPANRDAAT